MCEYDSRAVFGGSFTQLGDGRTAATHIAAWNGASWAALGSFPGGVVNSCTEFNGNLVVAADAVVYAWNGATWSLAGSGFATSPYAYALVRYKSLLVAACSGLVQVWDGAAAWRTIGTMGSWVAAMAVFGDYLFVGGNFMADASFPSSLVAKYDGATWSGNAGPLGPATSYDNYVLALAVADGALYAAGILPSVGHGVYVLSTPTGAWAFLAPLAGRGICCDVHFIVGFRGRLYLGTWQGGSALVLSRETNSFVPVGAGELASCRGVHGAAVVNDTLYLGGDFAAGTSSGAALNAVAWG